MGFKDKRTFLGSMAASDLTAGASGNHAWRSCKLREREEAALCVQEREGMRSYYIMVKRGKGNT
jgi:hypothetical protein